MTRPRLPAWERGRLEQIELAWRSPELTRQEIADRFAVSLGSLCRIARAHGWPPRQRRGRPTVLTPDELARLEQACRAGVRRIELARRFGIGPTTLRRIERQNGWPPPAPGGR